MMMQSAVADDGCVHGRRTLLWGALIRARWLGRLRDSSKFGYSE